MCDIIPLLVDIYHSFSKIAIMFKKCIAIGTTCATLAFAIPVFAQTTQPTTETGSAHATSTANAATKIACIGAAVNAREATLNAGIATYTNAVQAAYTARATALNNAYTGTTTKQVRDSVKKAWSTFRASIKDARQTWKTTQKDAWATFKTAAKACKAPSGASDSEHSSSEVSGQ
jgi:hypothetical protein